MKHRLAVLFLFAFALCAPALVSAQQATEQYWPEPWHMWSGGWGFWWIFPLLMFFLMIAVCVGVFLLMHRAGSHAAHRWAPWHMMGAGSSPWGDPTYSALQILNERFAKGEIQKQEYEDKKAAILLGSPR
jgi:putative membrane protein